MRSAPLANLVRQGKAVVARASAGTKPGELRCDSVDRSGGGGGADERRGLQPGDAVAVTVLEPGPGGGGGGGCYGGGGGAYGGAGWDGYGGCMGGAGPSYQGGGGTSAAGIRTNARGGSCSSTALQRCSSDTIRCAATCCAKPARGGARSHSTASCCRIAFYPHCIFTKFVVCDNEGQNS